MFWLISNSHALSFEERLMNHRLRHIVRGAAALLLLALTASMPNSAQGGFTVTLDSVSGVGPFTFAYSATIPVGDQINSGDFFRIFDFNGYVAGSALMPAGWTLDVSNTNPTPPPNVILSRGDDVTLPNLTFTYTGVGPIVGGATVSGFSARSEFGSFGVVKDFVGRATKSTGNTAGTFVDSVGDVGVPGAVPEPASVVSLLLGGTALAAAGRRYCRRA